MRFLIFIPPRGFRDESVSLIKLFFDKWGVQYWITSYTSNECVGLHGAVYKPDMHTSKVSPDEFDGIVLIDGKGVDDYKLQDYRPLLDMIYRLNQNRRYILSIGNASKIPAKANIVKDKRVVTDDPESKRLINLFHGQYSENRFEIADNLITIKTSSDIEDSMQKILDHMGVS